MGLEAHGAHAARCSPTPASDGSCSPTRSRSRRDTPRSPRSTTPARSAPAASSHSRASSHATGSSSSCSERPAPRPGGGRHARRGASSSSSDGTAAIHAAHHWANEAALGTTSPPSSASCAPAAARRPALPPRSQRVLDVLPDALAGRRDRLRPRHVDRGAPRPQAQPALAERPLLPVLPRSSASTLALEAIRLLVKLDQPTLVDQCSSSTPAGESRATRCSSNPPARHAQKKSPRPPGRR